MRDLELLVVKQSWIARFDAAGAMTVQWPVALIRVAANIGFGQHHRRPAFRELCCYRATGNAPSVVSITLQYKALPQKPTLLGGHAVHYATSESAAFLSSLGFWP